MTRVVTSESLGGCRTQTFSRELIYLGGLLLLVGSTSDTIDKIIEEKLKVHTKFQKHE